MPAEVPITRTDHVSAGPDEAWDLLSQVYMQVRPKTSSPAASVRVETAATPDLAADRGSASAAVCRFDPSPGLLNLMTVQRGHLGMDAGRGGHVDAGPGECFLYLPDRSADLEWDELEILPVRLSQHEVAELAAAMTGLTEDAFRFESARPVSVQHGQMWVRAAQLVSSQLSGVAGNSMTAVLHRTLITVAAAAALVVPSTAMTRGYLARPGDVRPAAVRRAVAYVDAHASLPITISDAASAAGTSAHALRAAFRRHLGTSFTAYLRRVRAAAARDDLERAGEGEEAPMETIALRWGFLSAPNLHAALDDGQHSRWS